MTYTWTLSFTLWGRGSLFCFPCLQVKSLDPSDTSSNLWGLINLRPKGSNSLLLKAFLKFLPSQNSNSNSLCFATAFWEITAWFIQCPVYSTTCGIHRVVCLLSGRQAVLQEGKYGEGLLWKRCHDAPGHLKLKVSGACQRLKSMQWEGQVQICLFKYIP